MASRKEYTYQIKGNKISLLEKDFTTTDGLNYTFSGTAGDGITDDIPSGSTVVKSPLSSVTDGIEIEYAYSPEYQLPALQPDVNAWGLVGWTIVDEYLTFLSSASVWPSGSTAVIAANEYIYIGNSSRWTGLHKVQETQGASGSHGGIKTYTKVNQSIKYFTDSSVDFATNETIANVDAGFDELFTSSTAVPYIWISGSDESNNNNGLFSGWSFDTTTLDLSSATWHYAAADDIFNISTAAATIVADGTNVIYVREAFYDPSYVVSDLDILSDESDTIDLPPYLSKALVYYVKAKVAEDQMNIEVKEYMMREFRKMLEKHESSKIAGPRMMMPGNNAIR
jgi:hypothetical protein